MTAEHRRDRAGMADIAMWFLMKKEMNIRKMMALCFLSELWSERLLKERIAPDAEFTTWGLGNAIPAWKTIEDTFPESLEMWLPHPVEHDRKRLRRIEKALGSRRLELLEDVMDTYGDYSSDDLEVLIHMESSWQKAEERERRGKQRIISEEDMKEWKERQ